MPAALHHWDLHVWLWKPNPAGLFSAANTRCAARDDPYTVAGQPPRFVEP